MKTSVCCAFAVMATFTSPAVAADELSWTFAWDQQLPSLVLHDVSMETENYVQAWRALTADHLVRCVLIAPYEFGHDKPFAFACEACTVAELLDALCENYGCRWTTDDTTGVIWIGPENWQRDIAVDERVEISTVLRAVPMLTGVLQTYLPPHIQVPGSLLRRELNSRDYPVSIASGTYSIFELLNRCLVWNPAVTFVIDYYPQYPPAPRRLQVIPIPLHTFQVSMEGTRLFWEVETGKTDLPTVNVLVEWLGDPSPRKRWAAQSYRRMTQDLRVSDFFASGLRNETEIRALFALLQSWVPKMIPNTTTSYKPMIEAALASNDFEGYGAETKLRLVALALASSHEMSYREAKSEELNLNPNEPHLDQDPQIIAARKKEAPWREALLQRIPAEANRALVVEDFDLHAFFNNYPRVAKEIEARFGSAD